jgi:hypothetical protein
VAAVADFFGIRMTATQLVEGSDLSDNVFIDEQSTGFHGRVFRFPARKQQAASH